VVIAAAAAATAPLYIKGIRQKSVLARNIVLF